MNKRELRAFIRRRHQGEEARAAQSEALCCAILSSREYKAAAVVGGYMPLKWEADITPVLLDALKQGKRLVLPLCGKAPYMTLRQVRSMDQLLPDRYGISSPPEDAPVVPVEHVDFLLVPLEGVSCNGMRLGKGGGYYDHLLQGRKPFRLGCALSWQWVDEIPGDPWDQSLDACADLCGIHYFATE